jgi:hypothetical protein
VDVAAAAAPKVDVDVDVERTYKVVGEGRWQRR